MIRYELPVETDIRLVIYNLTGQMIRTLVHQHQLWGRYAVAWDGQDRRGQDVASGVYL